MSTDDPSNLAQNADEQGETPELQEVSSTSDKEQQEDKKEQEVEEEEKGAPDIAQKTSLTSDNEQLDERKKFEEDQREEQEAPTQKITEALSPREVLRGVTQRFLQLKEGSSMLPIAIFAQVVDEEEEEEELNDMENENNVEPGISGPTSPRSPRSPRRSKADIDNDDGTIASHGGCVTFVLPLFNLLNAFLGPGILALPYAFASAGLIVGLVAMVIIIFMFLFSFYLLAWSSKHSGCYSYAALARKSLGRNASVFVDVVIMLDTFAALAAGFLLIGQSGSAFIESYLVLPEGQQMFTSVTAIIIYSAIVSFLLSLLTNITLLGVVSLFSVVPYFYLIGIQIFDISIKGLSPPTAIPVATSYQGFFVAFPILIFTFAAQSTLFPIYQEMQQVGAGHKDVKKVINISFVVAVVLNIFCGIIGVIVSGSTATIDQNIILTFPNTTYNNILLIALFVSSVFANPVQIFPVRDSFDRTITKLYRKFTKKKVKPKPKSVKELLCSTYYRRFVAETLGFYVASAILAIFLPSFATLLGISGALTKTLICFIFPAMFWVALGPKKLCSDGSKILAVLLIAAGLILGCVSLIMTLSHYVDLSSCSFCNTTTDTIYFSE